MAARALLWSSSKRKQACTSTKRRRPIKSPPRAGLNLLLVGMGPSRRLRASPAGCRGFRKAFFAPPNVLARWQVMIHARRPGQLARAKGHRHARRLPQGSIVCLCGMQGVHGGIRDDPKLGSLDNLWVYRCSEFLELYSKIHNNIF